MHGLPLQPSGDFYHQQNNDCKHEANYSLWDSLKATAASPLERVKGQSVRDGEEETEAFLYCIQNAVHLGLLYCQDFIMAKSGFCFSLQKISVQAYEYMVFVLLSKHKYHVFNPATQNALKIHQKGKMYHQLSHLLSRQ